VPRAPFTPLLFILVLLVLVCFVFFSFLLTFPPSCSSRFLTIFSKALPLEAVSRVWDNYFVEGDTFLWRTVLGLLSFHSETILTSSYDQCLQFLTHLPHNFDLDGLFEAISAIKLNQAQLTELLRSHELSL
jgi:hypothetical protein